MSDIDAITTKVLAYIKQESILDGVEEINVGFSGGSDSTMLLSILYDNFKDMRIKAVHLNHGIRGEDAERDQSWCENFCRCLDIQFNAQNLHVPENQQSGESTEMASRRLRTSYWEQSLESSVHGVLALGHHIDDKIENFLIRAIRGSNSSGLTNLRSQSRIYNFTIIRPLLCLEKSEVLAYLTARGINDYREDLSNQSDFCPRNVVRNSVLPILLQDDCGKAGLIRSINILEEDARFIENEVDRNLRQLPQGKLTVAALIRTDFCMWSRFLRKWVFEKTGDDTPIRGTTLQNLRRNLKEESRRESAIFNINKRFNLCIYSGEIHLQPVEKDQFALSLNWDWRKSRSIEIPDINRTLTSRVMPAKKVPTQPRPNCEYFDPQSLGKRLIIRTRAEGDRMTPFGGIRNIRVKKLITNAKLTPDEKQKLILICHNNGDIIWIPSVRRANLGVIDRDSDNEVVELEYESS